VAVEKTVRELTASFQDKVSELREEPEFQWKSNQIKHALEQNGDPSIKLTVGNVPLEYDLWEGLRNPAVVGLYPAGLREIWEFYANRKKERVDEAGRSTIFQTPRSYNYAIKRYPRVVIISAMLPFAPQLIGKYTEHVLENEKSSSHLFSRMYEDVNLMIDKAVGRVAMDLATKDTVAIPMNGQNVASISTEAIAKTHQGGSHGPSKGGHYPQKSIAALIGLGQFGISRIIFRDEIIDGKIQRFTGPVRSIIMFDQEDLVKDGDGGVMYPSENWRKFLFKLFDFTNTDPSVNKYRFCTYIPHNDVGCGMCIDCCPSGAQYSSAPASHGAFPEQLVNQQHRFWDEKLQFDFGRCCDERGQMGTLFPEWSCARCVSICASKGNRRAYATKNFYTKMDELTKTAAS
jgi:hypothetical protein